jgi:hypothetical protein
MLNLKELFEKHGDEFLRHKNIENPMHRQADLCAFLMLDKIAPLNNDRDIIISSQYDEITLAFDPKKVALYATEQEIIDLIRCGLRYDSDEDCFVMFV